jgi:hypothetical protein
MLLEKGENVHIMTQRLFEQDMRRHFIGEIIRASDIAILVEGYEFMFVQGVNENMQRGDKQCRVFALNEARHIINIIPTRVNVEDISYKNEEHGLVVTDGKNFKIHVHEFGMLR